MLNLWTEFNLGLLECDLSTNMSKSKFFLPMSMPNYESAILVIPQEIEECRDGVKLAG